ncbi:unnamed protein product [Moneuplotes crassus]|uniref:Ribulose-phosphate 3-epimerase n=1 Tax=Euplotes crassus TaxID=5936 RepID=A0AAD1XRL1_EUPCR|nr:unnamed protein product [Moneuplotes crassus]
MISSKLARRAIISPSLLASDFAKLAEDASNIISLGADWLHVDVMDGHFVPNIAIGFPIIKSLRKALPDVFLDCHMMVQDPEKWVEPLKEAGGSMFVFHYEADIEDYEALIAKIRDNGMRAGIAVKPYTEIDETIYDLIKKDLVDMFLVMTVEPGFGGQSFIEDAMPKLKKLREDFPHLDIQVDGGVKRSNMDISIKAGANVLVSGTGLFGQDDAEQIMKEMKAGIDEVTASEEESS